MNHETPSILKMARLPARIDLAQAADLLGFSANEILVLVREKLIEPLNQPGTEGMSIHFSSVELQNQANDKQWLVRANEIIARYIQGKPTFRDGRIPVIQPLRDSGQSNQTTTKVVQVAAPSRLALKLKEVATCLGVSEKTVRRLVYRGLLRRCQALRHIVIERKEIDRFLQENQ
jgi:hypothetical protein